MKIGVTVAFITFSFATSVFASDVLFSTLGVPTASFFAITNLISDDGVVPFPQNVAGAMQFTPTTSGTVSSLTVLLDFVQPEGDPSGFALFSLYTSAGAFSLGTDIADFSIPLLSTGGYSDYVLSSLSTPFIMAGTQYWLEGSTTVQVSDPGHALPINNAIHWANVGVGGGTSNFLFVVSDNGDTASIAPAIDLNVDFEFDGTPVSTPEPNTTFLLGSAIALLVTMRKVLAPQQRRLSQRSLLRECV